MNPLNHCLERLHLGDNTKLLERAKQYQSQCASKVPVKTFKGPNSQHVISIQLAYESLGFYDWNSKLAPELAGCSPKAYDTTMSAVRKLLNLQSTITFDTLGVTFGSTTMATHAQDLWSTFVQQHINQLGPAQQVSVKKQLESALWKAAAFYVCAKAVGVHIDKTKLQTLCTCDSVEFKKSVQLIQQECESQIKELKTHSTSSSRPSRKRQSTVKAADNDNGNDECNDKAKPTKKKSKTNERLIVTKTKAKEVKSSRKNSSDNTNISTIKQPSIPKENSVLLKKAPTKKRGAVSGIVSMINVQDYRSSKKYKDYIQWEHQMKQRLSKADVV